MMMRLQHTRPDGEVDTYHLKPGRKFHLGRGSMCEVRILDLKLSRKHCVIEHGPRGWMIEDLGSTNGCRLDGQQIVGSAPLQVGHTIAIGQTTLRIDSLVPVEDAGENSGAQIIPNTPIPAPVKTPAAGTRTPVPAKKDTDPPTDGRRTPLPGNRTPAPTKPSKPMTPAMRTPTPGPAQEDLPGEDDSDPRARRPTAELDANDWQPEPADAHVKTGPLAPLEQRKPIDVRGGTLEPISASSEDDEILDEIDTEAERRARPAKPAIAAAPAPLAPVTPDPQPAAPAAKQPTPPPQRYRTPLPPAADPTRPRGPTPIKPVTIRVGAASDAAAPEPTPAAEDGPGSTSGPSPVTTLLTKTAPAPAAGEERSFSITLLGRRVGPLTRAEARDLKARELKGQLTEADLEGYPKL